MLLNQKDYESFISAILEAQERHKQEILLLLEVNFYPEKFSSPVEESATIETITRGRGRPKLHTEDSKKQSRRKYMREYMKTRRQAQKSGTIAK